MIPEAPLFEALAARGVDRAQRWIHRVDVQLAPERARMRQDAAIRDQQPSVPWEPRDVVRIEPLRFDLADEAEIARVAYAEHAALAFVIVLRRVQQRAVRREHTVTCEVPSRGRLER